MTATTSTKPAAASAVVKMEEEEKEKDDEKKEEKTVEKSAMEKALDLLNGIAKRLDNLDSRLTVVEKSEHVPPKDSTKAEAAKNAESDYGDEVHSEEAATKPAKDNKEVIITKEAPANRIDINGIIKKAVAENTRALETKSAEREALLRKEFKDSLAKEVPELIKASGVELPYAWADAETRAALRDPFGPNGVIAKAIKHDRDASGGRYATSGDGMFGIKSGRGDARARRQSYEHIAKMVGQVRVE